VIPYFPQPAWHIGRFEIHAFGIAAAAALNAGYFLTASLARRARLNESLALNLVLLTVALGLVGGHAAFLVQHPDTGARWFQIWDGQSGAGVAVSLLFAACAIYAILRRYVTHPWAYLNLYGFVVVAMWACVRAGNALAHDHLGRLTTNWLGVQFPDGTRFDLGLLEFFAALLTFTLFVILKQHGYTRFLALSLIAFGATRLALALLTMHLNQPLWTYVTQMALSGGLCIGGLALFKIPRENHGTVGISVKPR